MIVNVRLDIDDFSRKRLAAAIDGKESNRLATRKDVNAFVQGCIDRATQPLDEQPQTTHTTAELGEVERLRAAGHDDSYIRGWLQVGERLGLN